MIKNLESRLESLRIKEMRLQDKLKKDFQNNTIYYDCGVMDDMEKLMGVKAKIELLEELIDDFAEKDITEP